MKQYIAELKSTKKNFSTVKCSNPEFMAKPYAAPLKRMNFRIEGKMKSSGVFRGSEK